MVFGKYVQDLMTREMIKQAPKENNNAAQASWTAPKNTLRAGLYLLPTPIGNLGDITLRALDTLTRADVIWCEDTRVTKKLLSYFSITDKRLEIYNDHSDDKQRARIIEDIKSKEQIAVLVSDAGTPLVSDPGYKLVEEAIEAGVHVSALPGANAVLPALQLSGLPSDSFAFIGFLPTKAAARQKRLEQWAGVQTTLIAYETAPRLLKTLQTIHEIMGDRQVAVVREISKLYEEAKRGSASELIEHYTQEGAPKGEIALVIEGAQHVEYTQQDIKALLEEALKKQKTKHAAAEIAQKTGWSKKELYQLALEIANE